MRSGVETRYVYDAAGNLLAEAEGSNTITRYYVHGAGLLAAITPADAVYCYHFDGVGNTVAITDSSETVVNSYDYSPFGMIISENETFPQPFKFVGKLGVMAESNGFYYMRARYYDPVIGRFISEDPLGFDGGDVNLYVYGGNNPLLVVDPWGMFDLQASTRNVIDRLGGEQMLSNLQKLSAIAAAATIESGAPSLVFAGMAVVAGGLNSSLYSQHPYRDTVQSVVIMPMGSKNPGADLLVDELLNQGNQYTDRVNNQNSQSRCNH